MLGFLDRLMKRGSGRDVDLPFDPAPHMPVQDNYLRPDWAKLSELVGAMPEEQRYGAWSTLVRRWLKEQAPLMHETYAVYDSEHFLLMTGLSGQRARLLLEFAEQTWKKILKDLGGAGRDKGDGPLALLHFRGGKRYSGYLAPFGPPDTDWTAHPGCFLHDGYPRVALLGEDQNALERNLPRQLTHAALNHLEMPMWLEEGLTIVMQSRFGKSQPPGPEDIQKTAEFWSKVDLQHFWSGYAFTKSGEAYILAWLLAGRILGHYSGEALRGFLTGADRKDGGAAAARENLGCTLESLVQGVLEQGH